MYIHSTGITIGLEDNVYRVQESARKVEICAILLHGVLERKAVVTLFTTDGSATGINWSDKVILLYIGFL